MVAFIASILLALSATSTLAAPTDSGLVGPVNTPPTQDPFYQPDAGFNLASAQLGSIIKIRQVRPKDSRIDTTWQLLYKSSSQNGTALASVATVFVPKGAPKDRFVLTARYENANSRSCGPSWRYANGSIDDGNFFDKKWIVTSSDYEGPDAANGANRLNGQVLLDAGRATLAFTDLGLSSNPKIVINGYSGGASAASWAASLYASYAPELNVVGSTFGGTPADMRAIIKYIDGGLFTGLGLLGAFGLGNAYSAIDKRLTEILTPTGAQLRADTAVRCGAAAYQSLVGKKLLSTDVNKLGQGILTDSVIAPVLDDLVLGSKASETPKMPTYVYQGNIDEIIPAQSVNAAIQRLCANGANILYSKIYLADHFAGFLNPNVVTFIDDRFNGKSWTSGCRYVDVVTAGQTLNFQATGSRQQIQPNSTIQQQAQQKQAAEKQAQDQAAASDPATQKKAIEDRIAKLNQGQN